jgi:hypothetical protein
MTKCKKYYAGSDLSMCMTIQQPNFAGKYLQGAQA